MREFARYLRFGGAWVVGAALLGACSNTVAGDTGGDSVLAADAGSSGEGLRADASTTDASPGEEPEIEVLSQSGGAPVADANVNCRYGPEGPHTNSQHFRVFPASSIGGTRITEAVFPIEIAESPTGTQSATVKFHRLIGDIVAGEYEPISELTFEVPDTILGEVRIPLNLFIAADVSVVVEVAMGDGEQERNLRFGHNFEAQTAPTYYASSVCGPQLLPIDLANLNNPFEPGQTFAAHSWLVSLTVERLP